MSAQGNRVLVALIAALAVPWVERLTGLKLSTDDVASLVGLSVAAAHGLAALLTRYFPPPPAPPAKG